MDRTAIKIDPDECIPASHLQLQFNECQRCIEQEIQIQSLRTENTNLRQICTEQIQMIEKLKTELARLHSRPDEFEHLTAEPLSPIMPIQSFTPQPEKCFVCTGEYIANDGYKHICNGETEIGCEYCDEVFTSTSDLIDHLNICHNETKTRFYRCTKCPEMFTMELLLQFHTESHPQSIDEPFYICNMCSEHFPTAEQLNEHQNQMHKRASKAKNVKNQLIQPKEWVPVKITTNKTAADVCRKPGRPAKREKPVESYPPIMRLHTELAAATKPKKSVKSKSFQCTNCVECFTTRKKMLRHRKQEHGIERQRFYECYICKENFKSMRKTQIHLKEHLRSEKCAVCQEWFTKSDLDSHICAEMKTMSCGYCQQMFATTKSLLQHLQNCKSEKLSYECGKCPKYFLMESLAELHRKNHKDNEPPKMFYCTMCSASFNCRRQLKLHRERHNDTREFLCDECGKGFLCAENLRHHKRTHNKKTIKCPQCDFTCLGVTAYKRHVLRHQNIKFVCDICNLQLSSTAKLAIHKKIHTRTEADRTHACPVCLKTFFTSKSARSHLLKAHTTKRFECDMCSQSYKYKGDLNKHKRAVHSAGYLYVCPHCAQRFPQSYELDQHLFEHATAPDVDHPMPA